MKARFIATAVGALLTAAMVASGGVASATPIAPPHMKAVVLKQVPVLPNGVSVTLGAATDNLITPSPVPVLYRWDLTNDNVFETPFSTSPMTTQFYRYLSPHAGPVTARIVMYVAGVPQMQDTVTFTLKQITLHAVVLKQAPVYQKGVSVTLGAVHPNLFRPTPSASVLYRWDLTNDGFLETPFSTSPMTTQFYGYHSPHAGPVTARLVMYVGGVQSAQGFVTFTLKRISPYVR